MVLEEDPNIGMKAAKAACVQPIYGDTCASRNQQRLGNFFLALWRLYQDLFLNPNFIKKIGTFLIYKQTITCWVLLLATLYKQGNGYLLKSRLT